MPGDSQGKIPSGEQHGVVVKFDSQRGFGFIRPDGAQEGGHDVRESTPDVFVHIRNVQGRKTLHPGQRATYYVTRTEKGPAAINVRVGSVLAIPYLRFMLIGVGSALLLLVGLATVLDRPASLALWLVMWVTALSLATFGVYGYDKLQAKQGGLRVPEVVLHLIGLLGGTPGAFVAMRLFHHKTNKARFQAVFWATVLLQVGALAFWLLRR